MKNVKVILEATVAKTVMIALYQLADIVEFKYKDVGYAKELREIAIKLEKTLKGKK